MASRGTNLVSIRQIKTQQSHLPVLQGILWVWWNLGPNSTIGSLGGNACTNRYIDCWSGGEKLWEAVCYLFVLSLLLLLFIRLFDCSFDCLFVYLFVYFGQHLSHLSHSCVFLFRYGWRHLVTTPKTLLATQVVPQWIPFKSCRGLQVSM